MRFFERRGHGKNTDYMRRKDSIGFLDRIQMGNLVASKLSSHIQMSLR